MARFVVHIGDGKCGSTAIQSSLYQSRASLAEQGILFETLTPSSGHTVIPLLLGLRSRVEDPARLDLARGILELLRSKSEQYEWIVLSAENLINLDPAELPQLLSWVSPKADDVHAIAYVREPSAMYLSSVQQILKGNHHYVRPENYLRRVDRKIMQWHDQMGADNFTLRLFDRTALVAGDAVSDFSAYLSRLTGRTIDLVNQQSNSSMTAEQMQVMQRYRRQVLKNAAGTVVGRSTLLARMFSEMNDIRRIGHQPQLTEQAEAVVGQANRPVVEALNARFPSLAMPVVGHGAGPSDAPYPWTSTKLVSAILRSCDEDIVEQICAVLPDLNDGQILTGRAFEDFMADMYGCSRMEVAPLCDVHAHYLKRLRKCPPVP